MRIRRGDEEQRTIDQAWAAIELGEIDQARALLRELPHRKRREAARALVQRNDHQSVLVPADPELVLDLFERAHRELIGRISEYAQGPATHEEEDRPHWQNAGPIDGGVEREVSG